MGGKAFTKRNWFIMAQNNFVPLVNSFITNMLKCKAHLTKFKCVCVTMSSLVMSPFSCDYIITKVVQIKVA